MLRKLNDVFTDIPGKGIFYYLQNHEVPWQDDNINTMLDSEYHFNIAGARFCSPLVRRYADEDDGSLTEANCAALAGILFAMYGQKWNKLWDTLNFEYDPIQNYSMTEKMRDHEKETIYDSEELRTPDTERVTINDLQGFNSSDYVPSDKTTETETGTDSRTHTGTDTETLKYDLTREGNIGVTTSQQMIESERNLWVLWQFFYDVVFPDINRVLTLSIY